jgi:hypothetical protein
MDQYCQRGFMASFWKYKIAHYPGIAQVFGWKSAGKVYRIARPERCFFFELTADPIVTGDIKVWVIHEILALSNL